MVGEFLKSMISANKDTTYIFNMWAFDIIHDHIDKVLFFYRIVSRTVE